MKTLLFAPRFIIIGSACLIMGGVPRAGADVTEWWMQGLDLKPRQVVALESRVAAKPDDIEARVKILGSYFSSRIDEESARAAMQPHILWIIRNIPASEAAGSRGIQILARIDPPRYEEAAKAWEEQVASHPADAKVLGNAAAFFLMSDKPRAKALLLNAQKLELRNPLWAKRLRHLESLP